MSLPNIREAIYGLSAAISADPTKAPARNVPATARLTEGLRCELSGPYNSWMAAAGRPSVVHRDRDRNASSEAGGGFGGPRSGVHEVKIGAPSASPDVLREMVTWADRHSPVTCTMRQAPECSLDIRIV